MNNPSTKKEKDLKHALYEKLHGEAGITGTEGSMILNQSNIDKKQRKREEFERAREELMKRNNHLFVKDYGKKDYSMFFFDEKL